MVDFILQIFFLVDREISQGVVKIDFIDIQVGDGDDVVSY